MAATIDGVGVFGTIDGTIAGCTVIRNYTKTKNGSVVVDNNNDGEACSQAVVKGNTSGSCTLQMLAAYSAPAIGATFSYNSLTHIVVTVGETYQQGAYANVDITFVIQEFTA